jgi:hypothetical protein
VLIFCAFIGCGSKYRVNPAYPPNILREIYTLPRDSGGRKTPQRRTRRLDPLGEDFSYVLTAPFPTSGTLLCISGVLALQALEPKDIHNLF